MPDAPSEMSWLQTFRLRLTSGIAPLNRLARTLRRFGQRTDGYILLFYAATVAWMALWAWYDIAILKGAFPAAPGYQSNLDIYWTATWKVVFPITTILAFRRHAWLPLLAFALGGWEDILFFWIQGVPVPATTPWLTSTPTAALVHLRAAVFLIASIAGTIVARHPAFRIRHVPLPLVLLLAGFLGGFEVFLAAIPTYVGARWGLGYLARRRARPVGSQP